MFLDLDHLMIKGDTHDTYYILANAKIIRGIKKLLRSSKLTGHQSCHKATSHWLSESEVDTWSVELTVSIFQ